jgi:hypothetical protein
MPQSLLVLVHMLNKSAHMPPLLRLPNGLSKAYETICHNSQCVCLGTFEHMLLITFLRFVAKAYDTMCVAQGKGGPHSQQEHSPSGNSHTDSPRTSYHTQT